MSVLYARPAWTLDLVAWAIDLRGISWARDPSLRRKSSGTFRKIGAGVRCQGIPKQNQSCVEQRCGCGAAAQTHADILRMLRLAFISARTLVARETVTHISKCIVCQRGAGGTAQKTYCGKVKTGCCLSSRRRPDEFRTAVWIGVATAIMHRTARVG